MLTNILSNRKITQNQESNALQYDEKYYALTVINARWNFEWYHCQKEYWSELMVDCSERMESECCLVQEDTKEQKSLNLTAILLLYNSER